MNVTVVFIFIVVISLALVLCLVRMLRGPTASDRAVAVDTACTITTALLVILALLFDRYVYLDVSLVYAILTFVGIIAIARFLERGI
jgi:multicomponent Na+:H+ antiporter subunit F